MTAPRLGVLPLCALVLGGLVGLTHAAPCAFDTEEADVAWATVSPTGATPFRLRLDKRPLTATPGSKGISTLEVKSPLRFLATQATNQLGARVEKRTAIAGGRIVLARGLRPSFPAMADSAFASVVDAGAIPVHLPLVGLSMATRPTLPCAVLTISHTDDDFDAPTMSLPTRAVRFVDTRDSINLYEKRELARPLEVRFEGSFLVVAERDNWVRLRAKWSDGSVVQGWVPMGAVTIKQGIPPEAPGSHGFGGMHGICGGGHRPVVKALRLHSHAPIHDGPGGEIWAHTAGTIDVEVFATLRADGWIQIAKVEGFPKEDCSEHSRIWVHSKHVLWSPVGGGP